MTSDTSMGGSERYEWEVHLFYDPMETHRSGQETAFVEADTRENAIQEAREKTGMETARAYPVYQLRSLHTDN